MAAHSHGSCPNNESTSTLITTNINTCKFIAITEAIGTCIKDFQIAVERKTFWRGCKHYVQLWIMYFDAHMKLIFEEWHYGWRRLMTKIITKIHILKIYLSGFRYGFNRGRHWDRKRRNG